MSAKIKSPSHKCFPTTRGHEIKIISKIDCFINSNAKMTQVFNHKGYQVIELQTISRASNRFKLKQNCFNKSSKQKFLKCRQRGFNQLVVIKNLKLKEEGDKNKLIEMLIDDRTEIKRVTSLHLPQDKDNQQSKSNFRLQSPNHMEFTFYKSPNKGLPKEFQITPSKKMFF